MSVNSEANPLQKALREAARLPRRARVNPQRRLPEAKSELQEPRARKQNALDSLLIPHVGHYPLYFRPLIGSQWQKGETRRPSVVSVQIQGVLERGNSKLAGNARCRLDDALLLELRQLFVSIFPRGVDLEARGRSGGSKGEHCSGGSGFERQQQLLRRSGKQLE